MINHKKKLLVLGAGPKGCAIAAKAKILRDLGIADIHVTLVDQVSVGANWTGKTGYTNGQQRLGTPPDKDVVFPYVSDFGSEVDMLARDYSWQTYQIERRLYSKWIDRGRNHPTHAEWATYLYWSFTRSQADLILGRVLKIRPLKKGLTATINLSGKTLDLVFDGIVFTGPGDPHKIDGQDSCDSELVLNGKNYWQRTAIFDELGEGRVAVVGSGETAASIVVSIMDIAPRLRVDVINRHGTLFTRGESYHENRLYSDPEMWPDMEPVDRDEFIRRTDRGVFSIAAQRVIDQLDIRIVGGNVTHIRTDQGHVCLSIARKRKAPPSEFTYQRAIIATGFNALTSFMLLPESMRPTGNISDLREQIDHYLRLPLIAKHSSESAGKTYNLHFPMLAGFSQGPGFPNLSCLGTVADRILKPYVEEDKPAKPRADFAEFPDDVILTSSKTSSTSVSSKV